MPRGPGPPTALIAARYELLRELRVDSEAVDWEGFDTRLERAVIVRLLRPDLADDAGASDRFWRAVRADALQTHDPDRRVLDGGTDAETGRPFVVRALPTDVAGVAEQPRAAASATPTIVAQPRRSRFAGSGRWIAVGAVAVAALVVIALRPGVEGWLAWVNTPAARTGVSFVLPPADASTSTPRSTAAATPRALVPTSGPTAGPTRAPTATVAEVGQSRRIVNTDGAGVALRAAPGGDRFPGKGYDEGDTVQAFEQSGAWTRIRGADGREGWVLSVTLAP